MKYQVLFKGRKVGAIGIFYLCDQTVEAPDAETARALFWDSNYSEKWECHHIASVVPKKEQSSEKGAKLMIEQRKYVPAGTVIKAGETVTLMRGSAQVEERTQDHDWVLPPTYNGHWWSRWEEENE